VPLLGELSPHLTHVSGRRSTSKMKLGMQVGLGPGHTMLDGNQAPPPPKGRQPQFSAHICCGQIAGWIKTPLGMEVGLSQGHIVLDGDPAPPPQKRGHSPPTFGPCLLWPNGWMYQNATWLGGTGRPRPRPHCARWGPSPHFLAMLTVAKRLDGSRGHLVRR